MRYPNTSRRLFLKENSIIGLATIAGLEAAQKSIEYLGKKSGGANVYYEDTLESLGGMSLPQLLDFHRKYLNEIYVPNWNRGVDWKYGGFANSLFPGQEPNFENKRTYYQGRGIWMFSYLYNHITGDKRHLEAAVKGRDFLVKSALNSDFRWNSFVSRDGSKRLSPPLDHYGDIYVVQGLAELYKATKDEKDIEMAIKTAHSVMDRLVSPSYQHVGAASTGLEPGTRRLPGWQHFLGALTPLLKVKNDAAIEKLARYCVRAICEYHWQPKYGVLLEILDDHFRPFTFDAPNWGNIKPRGVSGWHSIQASWMVMDEALRVMHFPTYRQGFEMGISTLEKTYIDGKGIPQDDEVWMALDNPEAKLTAEGKTFPLGALDDMLVYCLLSLEHIHDPEAISYYNKCFAVHNSRPEAPDTSGLLHTPRRFFYSIEILERIIKRGGKVSGVFV